MLTFHATEVITKCTEEEQLKSLLGPSAIGHRQKWQGIV